MAFEVPHKKLISGEGKNGGRKGVNSAIQCGKLIRGSINIKDESEEESFSEMLTPKIRVGVKQRKKGGRKFQEG